MPQIDPTGRSSRADLDGSSDGSSVEDPLDPAQSVQLQELLRLAGPDALRELIELYVEQAEPLISTIARLHETGAIQQLRRVAHFLRGSSASIGARELARRCARLERADPAHPDDAVDAVLEELARVLEALRGLTERLV